MTNKQREELKKEFYETFARKSKMTGEIKPKWFFHEWETPEKVAEFWLDKLDSILKETEEKVEKDRWCSDCAGCPEGHSSFWKTIVESEEWQKWEKEQNRLFSSREMEKCFDYDESRETGWLGKEHWRSFVEFIRKVK